MAKLFALSGQICFVAFISPYKKDRNFARTIHQQNDINFYECFINSTLEVCEGRDVKGLYKKARAGEIKNFTGISDPYEPPEQPELDVRTDQLSLDQAVDFVLKRMGDDGILRNNAAPRIAEALYKTISEEERKIVEALPSIEIDLE